MTAQRYIPGMINLLETTNNLRSVIKYINAKEVVKVTCARRYYGGHYIVTMGTPAYKEREFIKQAKKAKESFPIKKLQLKYYKEAQ